MATFFYQTAIDRNNLVVGCLVIYLNVISDHQTSRQPNNKNAKQHDP